MELELGPLKFGIVGAGRLGCAIGRSLQQRGFTVVHASSASEDGRQRASRLLGVPVHEDVLAATQHVDCVLVCVPDDAVGAVIARLATRPEDATPRRVRVVGTSAFGGLAALRPLAERGHDVGVLNPLSIVVDAGVDVEVFRGAGAAIGSDDDATRTLLHALAHAIGMLPFDLDESAWPLHAAACTIAANGATALLAATEDLAAEAGIHPDAARAAYGRLAASSVDRATRVGSIDALAGPVLRGDAAAVAAQVLAVRESTTQVDALFIPIVASIANRAFTSGRIDMESHRELLEAVLDPTQFQEPRPEDRA